MNFKSYILSSSIIIVVLISCSTNKEITKSYRIELDDLTKDQMIEYNIQAARIKPWQKQYHYDSNYVEGLKVSQDSVIFIFNYLKQYFVERTDDAIIERYWELDYQPIFEQDLLISLSYLAQQGNEEIENVLLDNFEYAFAKYFDRYKKGILPTPANGLTALSFQAFNRLPPSDRKIKLLLSLQGHNKDLDQIYNYESTNYYPFNYLLINYKDSEVDSFYNQYGYNYIQFLESKKYSEEHPNEKEWEYLDWRFNKMYPLFIRMYNDKKLKLKTRDFWKKIEIPIWAGVTH